MTIKGPRIRPGSTVTGRLSQRLPVMQQMGAIKEPFKPQPPDTKGKALENLENLDFGEIEARFYSLYWKTE